MQAQSQRSIARNAAMAPGMTRCINDAAQQ
jgi:hypothetical protein